MSAKYDKALINRGATVHGPTGTIDAAMEAYGATLIGREKWMEDQSPTSVAPRSHRMVLLRLVKNSSGINLKPGRLVRFKDGTLGTEVDGYTHQPSQGSYGVVDEFLPSTGVRDKDCFYVAVRGPTEVITNTAGDATNVISQGSLLVAATAASSQNDTNAGRVAVFSLLAATDATQTLNAANAAMNALGRAASAKTTANTDVRVLVDLDYHR